MCYAVIEVRYRNKTEQDQFVPMADEESAASRIEQLRALETVERITVFKPSETHRRVSSWEVCA